MIDSKDVWQRYIKILIYKLTKYTNKDFMSKISTMNTKDKITEILKLKKDLDDAYILQKDVVIPDTPALSVLREIYSFLYEDNNKFSSISYLRLLRELEKLEEYNGSNAAFKKIEIEKIEQAFLSKIKFDIKNILKQTKNSAIKSKVESLSNTIGHIIHISVIACGIMMCALLLLEHISKDANQTEEKFPTEEIARTDSKLAKLKEVLGIDRKTPQIGNALVNSAEFLQLADTCGAWSIIKSLDTLQIRANVKVIYQNKFEEEVKDTTAEQCITRQKRFAKLCSLAVNYTISEYPKYNKIIKSYPNKVIIYFVYRPSIKAGIHVRKTGEIYINESEMTFDNGANAFVLFCNIVHEMVHRLTEYNLKLYETEEVYRLKIDSLVQNGIRPQADDVDKYIQLVLDDATFLELDAYKFDYKVFHELFKGIITDKKNKFEFHGKQIYAPTYTSEFTESYLRARGLSEFVEVYKSKTEREKIIGEANEIIIDNLKPILWLVPPMETRLAQIRAGNYTDLKEELYKMRERILNPNAPISIEKTNPFTPK